MRTTIREISHGVFDGPHATPPPSETGAVFLGIGAIGTDGYIDESKAKRISEEDFPKWTRRVTPQAGDIVFSYEATLNLYAIIPSEFRGCLGRRIGLIRPDTSKVNTKFLFYYFYSPQWRSLIKSKIVQGATVDRISIEDFPDFSLELPSLETQNRIVQILEPYDSLIENNRRQIKLLEEAAQRLYKEWFVDLRFPGHEHTPIIDGIPQGWHRGHVSDIGTFTRGKTITKEQTRQGSIPVVAGGLAPAYYHDQANTRPPVVTISASGANAGYVSLYQVPVWASDCSYVDAGNTKNLYLMYAVCTYAQAAINHLRKGAAQPHVYASAVNELEILVGDSSIQRMYEAQVCPLFEKRALLSQQMTLLTEARDRLLPKLMSGEVEV